MLLTVTRDNVELPWYMLYIVLTTVLSAELHEYLGRQNMCCLFYLVMLPSIKYALMLCCDHCYILCVTYRCAGCWL